MEAWGAEYQAGYRPDTAVWVLLDQLHPAPDPAGRVDGYDCTTAVPGRLYRWERTSTGGWIGMVDYWIPHATPGTSAMRVSGPVPAWALARRVAAPEVRAEGRVPPPRRDPGPRPVVGVLEPDAY